MQSQRVSLGILVLLAVLPSASAQSNNPTNGIRNLAGSGSTWAMQAMATLTGGLPVNSVTESGTVTRTLGSDEEQGTITLRSSGIMASRVDIATSVGTRSEIRTWSASWPDGAWIDLQGQRHPMSLHNCWTDAVWFFPALSLLADYADPNLVFTDLGQEQYDGGSVEHIQVYRTASGLSQEELKRLAHLSTVDYYLASQNALPVAMTFSTHADGDLNVDISVVITFSGYQGVSGILVPFQVIKSRNGTTMLQISISSATPNG